MNFIIVDGMANTCRYSRINSHRQADRHTVSHCRVRTHQFRQWFCACNWQKISSSKKHEDKIENQRKEITANGHLSVIHKQLTLMGDFYMEKNMLVWTRRPTSRYFSNVLFSFVFIFSIHCLNFKANGFLHKMNHWSQCKHIVSMVCTTARFYCQTLVINMKYELKSVDCRCNGEVRAKNSIETKSK